MRQIVRVVVDGRRQLAGVEVRDPLARKLEARGDRLRNEMARIPARWDV